MITIGVIGARVAGREIACEAATAGYRTVLEDVSPEILGEGLAHIAGALQDALARGDLTRARKDDALANLSTARTVEDACRLADLLIEACPEELELKLEIFTLFDKFAKPGAILASNSSSFSINDLAAITFRAENCVGLQFYNQDPKKRLIRIIRAQETSGATIGACKEVARRMERDVLVVNEPVQA
ncbi:MAG: 3-hydroxyacyl-CoA dehydrogenase family protein [Candidatus Acidiferrales bacterium]